MDKIFLDANVLFSATFSDTGASNYLFRLGGNWKIKLYSSIYAINEAKKNLENKLGKEAIPKFLLQLSILSKADKSKYESSKYSSFIASKDAPILESAEKMKVDYLITLDRKDFMSKKMANADLPFTIMLPGDYLRKCQ